MKKDFRKIVYFDKETINNSLQQVHGGSYQKTRQSNSSTSIGLGTSVDEEIELKVELPFLAKLKFLLTGKLEAKYLHEWLSQTSITSTDIGLFEEIKGRLSSFKNVTLRDIVNSLTSLRYVSTLAKMVGQVDKDINLKELSSLLDEMEGYDVFDIGDNRYIRFNRQAYLSNYKRNDMSMAKLDVFCIYVGRFDRIEFDYINKFGNIQTIVKTEEKQKTLLDYISHDDSIIESPVEGGVNSGKSIMLYDAVCAYVSEISE